MRPWATWRRRSEQGRQPAARPRAGAGLLNAVLEPELWIAMGVVFAGGIMRGFSGFGAAMLVVPILSIL